MSPETARALVCLASVTGLVGCDATSERPPPEPWADAGQLDAGDATSDGGLDAGSEAPADGGESDAGGDGDAGSDPPALGVNDVSYLFPLPKSGEVRLLLGMTAAGERGELLPKAVYDTHIDHLWEGPSAELGHAWLRVLALRLDPCGGQTTIGDAATCQPEVRLSAQPIADDSEDPGTIDAAVHLIYEIDRAELDEMLAELLALKEGATVSVSDQPLGRHPIMVAEGLAGAFAQGVKEAILRHVGVDVLAKFTFMDRGRNSDNWRFHQLERAGDTFALAVIPATGGDTQQGVDELGSPDNEARFTSVHPIDDAISYPTALFDSTLVPTLASAEKAAALARLASFEDPTRFSSLNLDCGSCHVNTNARAFFEQLTGMEAEGLYQPPPGQNTERTDETMRSGRVLVSFGYMHQALVVSQRVINESARVADWFMNGVR